MILILIFLISSTFTQDFKPNIIELFKTKDYEEIAQYYLQDSNFKRVVVNLTYEESNAILKSLYFQKQFAACIDFTSNFIKTLEKSNMHYEVYAANYYIAASFMDLNQFDSAQFYYQKSLEAAYLTENPQNISRALNSVSTVAVRRRDYTYSISLLEEAMRVCEDSIDDAKFLSNIAYNYFRVGLLDSALHLNGLALKTFELLGPENESTWNWRIRFRMGHIEKRLKNLEATKYFKESLQFTEKNTGNYILSMSGIGQSQLAFNLDSANQSLSVAYSAAKTNGDKAALTDINFYRAEYYIKTNQIKELLTAIEEGKKYVLERNDMLGYSNYLIKESSYFELINEQTESLAKVNAAIDTLKKYNLKSTLSDALTQKFKVLNHFGRYKEALAVKEEEIKVREELFNDRSEAVYQILRTQNEMDKQESTIANQALVIDNNNLQITIQYISIALVIVALIFIFWQYRTRSKYAQKLETMFLDSRHRYMNNLLLLKNWFNEGKTEKNDEIISFAQNRIDAISTVNRHLDRLSYNKDTIEAKPFLEDISHNLLANREFTSDIENVPINMNVSGPLGMITNEIITNGLKYGEPPYAIRFHKNGNGYVLEIEDQGPGIETPEKQGTGSKVLRLLSRQLKGELTYQNKASHAAGEQGTLVSLRFKG